MSKKNSHLKAHVESLQTATAALNGAVAIKNVVQTATFQTAAEEVCRNANTVACALGQNSQVTDAADVFIRCIDIVLSSGDAFDIVSTIAAAISKLANDYLLDLASALLDLVSAARRLYQSDVVPPPSGKKGK